MIEKERDGWNIPRLPLLTSILYYSNNHNLIILHFIP